MDNTEHAPWEEASSRSASRQAGDSDTLRQKTLIKLREAIVTGQLAPNQRLVERDICVLTGVSRSSVREALRYLESEGLVESRGSKGMFVVQLSIEEAMQIYELRIAVEAAAAVHFTTRGSDEEIDELRRTFAAVEALALANAEEYWRQADLFFDIMMRGARNGVAYGLMQTLRTRIRYLRATTTRLTTPAYREGTVDHMRRLMTALAQRDGPQAAELVRSFIGRSAKFAVECLRLRDHETENAPVSE